MKKLEKFILILFISCSSLTSFAQQEAQFTQYMDNTLFVNPGYAGSRGMLNMTAIHREQWVGIKGAPRSTTFSLHSPLSYDNVGLGFTFVNDAVGPINQTMFYADFSYSIKFKKNKGKLAFGLKGGINLINTRTDQLQTTQGQDPNLLQAVRNKVNPNFGFGVYYHSKHWFAGVSTPKILQQNIEEIGKAIERRHYFIIAGGYFNLHKRGIWKMRPTAQLKFVDGSPLSIDASVAAIWNEKLWLGVMMRWADSFGGFIQYQFTPQFKVGFAYDQTTTRLANFNRGTYEILLSYDFAFKKKGIVSPRFF